MTFMKPASPYVGEVTRSLLGALLVIAVALLWGQPVGAMAAGGGAVCWGGA